MLTRFFSIFIVFFSTYVIAQTNKKIVFNSLNLNYQCNTSSSNYKTSNCYGIKLNHYVNNNKPLKNNLILKVQDTSINKYAFNSTKLKIVVGTEAAVTLGMLAGLNELWYSKFKRSSFHFFNDDNEWLQMDKVGHATSCYYSGLLGIEALRWCGVSNKKAIWYGGTLGLAFMTLIEVEDGLSSEWGFSIGDMAANTSGTALVIAQELLWKKQKITMKVSYHTSGYADYRPNVLGSNFMESMLKDYNGQTYWLSFNVHSFLPKNNKFPKWLGVALGYGADGMLGGPSNNIADVPYFKRARQFYFSVDVNLNQIKTKSKLVNTLFKTIGFLKFPMPTIEYNDKNEFHFHPLYF